MKLINRNVTQTMQTLYDCIVKAVEKGYYENFKINNGQLIAADGKFFYEPSQISISNFYNCTSYSEHLNGAVLYLIRTTDGKKGTLIDTRSTLSNSPLSGFIQKVNSINSATDQRKSWYRFLLR